MAIYQLNVDGRTLELEADEGMPLLYALTGEGRARGPKFGCGLGQCGACTVIVDGAAVRSCITPVSLVGDRAVRTLDGLAAGGAPHPVQAAFIEEQAMQCGYCTNGWIMTAVAALEREPRASDADIRAMFAGLKCRCGSHMAMLRAARRAADEMAAGSQGRGDGDPT